MITVRQDLALLFWQMDNPYFRTMNHKPVIQLIRYGLLGVAINFIGYSIYLVITYLGGEPKTTMSLLYLLGATASYIGNRKLTFAHKGSVIGSGLRYVIAHIFGYLINLVILIVMVDQLQFPHQWVQASAIFIVAAFLFLAFKFYVFSDASSFGDQRNVL